MARAVAVVLLATMLSPLACGEPAAPEPAITVHDVQLKPAQVHLFEGDTIRFEAVARNSLGLIAEPMQVSWSSTRSEVASVDSLGLVRARGAGQAEIRAQVGSALGRAAVSVSARTVTRFTRVTAGMEHTCALTETGRVYCWGANRFAQLASDTVQSTAAPVGIGIDDAVVAVAAGNRHTCAAGVGVWCWGANNAGQTGDWLGGDKVYTRPVRLLPAMVTVAVAAGSGHSCAVSADGRVYCWGTNGLSQLGRGAASVIEPPGAVSGGLGFVSIAAGHAHSCAVTTAGKVACWGWNDFGQTGSEHSSDCDHGTSRCVLQPTVVDLPERIVAVTAGFAFSCALAESQATYCWGVNAAGELGSGVTAPQSSAPLKVLGPHFVAIDAGTRHACGITSAGETFCWGLNAKGELGSSSIPISRVPVRAQVPRLHTVDAGLGHTCGVTDAGTVFCWGDPSNGQLGLGLPLAAGSGFSGKKRPVTLAVP